MSISFKKGGKMIDELNNLILEHRYASNDAQKVIEKRLICLMFRIIENNRRYKLTSNFDRKLNLRQRYDPFSGYRKFKN